MSPRTRPIGGARKSSPRPRSPPGRGRSPRAGSSPTPSSGSASAFREVFDGDMWTEPDMPDAWERWVRSTDLHHFVLAHSWLWPTMETLHYLGLSMLLGTVGLFDLRVLGLAKGIPPS